MRVLRSILGLTTTSWDTPVSRSAGGKGLDTTHVTMHAPQGGRDDQPLEKDEAADGETKQNEGSLWKKKPRDVSPLVLENLTSDKKMMMEIRATANRWWSGSMVVPS